MNKGRDEGKKRRTEKGWRGGDWGDKAAPKEKSSEEEMRCESAAARRLAEITGGEEGDGGVAASAHRSVSAVAPLPAWPRCANCNEIRPIDVDFRLVVALGERVGQPVQTLVLHFSLKQSSVQSLRRVLRSNLDCFPI